MASQILLRYKLIVKLPRVFLSLCNPRSLYLLLLPSSNHLPTLLNILVAENLAIRGTSLSARVFPTDCNMPSILEKLRKSTNTKVEQKATKYQGLSNNALLDKDLKKQRKATVQQYATAGAATGVVGTRGVSAAGHGGLATYHGAKWAKQELKGSMTRAEIQSRKLNRREPSAWNRVVDTRSGFVKGGTAPGVIEDGYNAYRRV